MTLVQNLANFTNEKNTTLITLTNQLKQHKNGVLIRKNSYFGWFY